MAFPHDFYWGAATASYQVEGAVREDGRGECIWHRFAHTPGKTHNGEHGDVACDHYHRYAEDVRLMQQLGLNAYRFSIAWARVLPQGTGADNPAGIAFYDRLIDTLLAAGIQPFITLYHWDLPQALQDRGGWANPDSVGWFVDYAERMTRLYGDRVKHWITHNEPWVVSMLGNFTGTKAPGIAHLPTALKVAHHLFLAHGAAVPVIQRNVAGGQAGITLDIHMYQPATDRPEDIAAARREDGYHVRWYTDPVLKGEYPADMVEVYGSALDGIDLSAVKAAAAPLDFVGVNYYMRFLIAHNPQGVAPLYVDYLRSPGAEYTEMGWEVYPQGLTDNLLRLTRDYNVPAIYITENGAAFPDPAPQNGIVNDPRRVAYLEAHVDAVAQAMQQGAPVKGYFVWSLLDNYEWELGYDKRFGIVHIDFATQQRTLKASAKRYAELIQAHRVRA